MIAGPSTLTAMFGPYVLPAVICRLRRLQTKSLDILTSLNHKAETPLCGVSPGAALPGLTRQGKKGKNMKISIANPKGGVGYEKLQIMQS